MMVTTVFNRSPVRLLMRSLRSFFCSNVNSGNSSSLFLLVRRRLSAAGFLSLEPEGLLLPDFEPPRSVLLRLPDLMDSNFCVSVANDRSSSAI